MTTSGSSPRDRLPAPRDAVCQDRPTQFVLVSGAYEPLTVARALGSDGVLACLAAPVGENALAVAVALRRFERLESLREEAARARQALEGRKLVERAKGWSCGSRGPTRKRRTAACASSPPTATTGPPNSPVQASP